MNKQGTVKDQPCPRKRMKRKERSSVGSRAARALPFRGEVVAKMASVSF